MELSCDIFTGRVTQHYASRQRNYFTTSEDADRVFITNVEKTVLVERRRFGKLFDPRPETSFSSDRSCAPCISVHYLSLLCHHTWIERCVFRFHGGSEGDMSFEFDERVGD
ncbi:hypothetical protein CASFOL_038008 [Castilleja foliolosa]|uniref:Uncharacterized protein n=1 Tax=Castilleja foliolosa TaxID=1961234 RepID=A0ABD3BLR1_9LAMI